MRKALGQIDIELSAYTNSWYVHGRNKVGPFLTVEKILNQLVHKFEGHEW